MARFSKTWFNPLYFHVLKYTNDPTVRKIMVYGGKSAAKTFSISELFAIKSQTENASAICYRKEQTTIRITLKPTFEKAIELLYMQSAFNVLDFRIESNTGSGIVFKGLDKEGKVKGIEGFKYILFDELDHFTQEEWTQANMSLRGVENQKLFATWNPIREDMWIKKEIDETEWIDMPKVIEGNEQFSQLDATSYVKRSADGKTILIKTSYLDNKWVVGADGYGYRDENLIYEYEKLKAKGGNNYTVNVLGEWGVLRTGMEYFPSFDSVKHVGEPQYVSTVPLHITFDMNVNPYMTLIVNQIEFINKRAKVSVIDEYCLPHPLNKTKYVCQKFFGEYYERLGHRAGLFYYGDATSKKNNTMTVDEIKNDYDIVENELRLMLNTRSNRVRRSNPPVLKRKQFIEDVLNGLTDIDFLVHKKCTHTINDMLYLKEGADGKKFKEEQVDKLTGAKYQKYGHTSDAEEYFLCEAFEQVMRQHERR